jgi:hypothetical protein
MRAIAFVVVLLLILLSAAALADVPGLMNYQGTLADDDGVALDATVSMTFSIHTDSTGGSQLWSEAQSAVSVSHGIFSVLLGRVNPISDVVFSATACWLQIQVGGDPVMAPRQRIVAVGYAFRAAEADTADHVRGGGSGSDGDWTIVGNDMYSAVSGNVGIGTTSPNVRLSLGTDINIPKIALYDVVGDFYGFGIADGRITIHTSDIEQVAISSNGNVGIGTWLPLKKLHLLRPLEPVSLRLEDWGNMYYDLTVDSLALNISSVLNSDVLVLKSGNVGIGTANPDAKLTVEGPNNGFAFAKINQKGTRQYMGLRLDRNNTEKWLFGMDSGSDKLLFRRMASSNDMVIDTLGNVGIGTPNPQRRLHILGANPRIVIEALSSNPEINLQNTDDTSPEVWSLYKDRPTDDLRFYQNGNRVTIQSATGNVGIGTTSPGQRLTVRGNILIESVGTGLPVVELGEGLDYAEGFDVSDTQEIGPGSVLIIDPDNPEKLKMCDQPYDRKVAGIVAGARGQGSGVRLGTGQFDHDVALAGRVHCNVDARYGEISPGDLLTTSPTPGHAMVVKDHSRAQGAILGKAMQRLEKGQRRQILVLVTLQ